MHTNRSASADYGATGREINLFLNSRSLASIRGWFVVFGWGYAALLPSVLKGFFGVAAQKYHELRCGNSVSIALRSSCLIPSA
jgi:hypothetical protein